MRDPHIERLHYDAGSGAASLSYSPNVAPLSFTNVLGNFDLRSGKLTVEPAEHFAAEAAAREQIDSFLRAWEIEADLLRNVGEIRFTFNRAEIIDRDPPPPGDSQIVMAIGVAAMGLAGMNATVRIVCSQYPEPPAAFAATIDVQRAHKRWKAYLDSKEPLQGMAYYVLTIVETFGGRRQAAATLDIEPGILSKFGELSSVRGEPGTARKAPKSGAAYQELSAQERAWLEAAVRKVIQRIGEHAAGKASTQIRMTDLPKLGP